MPYRSGTDDDRYEESGVASTAVKLTSVPNRSGGDSVPTKEEQRAPSTEDSDVEPDDDNKVSVEVSNIFDRRSLPVPIESNFAQSDINTVLKEAISMIDSSATPFPSDKGQDGVIVLDAEPDINLLLQQDSSTSTPPSMPASFDEMLQCDLVRPLSVVITPMSTPKVNRFLDAEENNTPTEINLFPSPHSSIEDEPNATSAAPEIVPALNTRTEVLLGKVKGAKIKRKLTEQKGIQKENASSVAEKSLKSSSSSQPAISSQATISSDVSAATQPDKQVDKQRLKSTLSNEFRIPLKPSQRNESRSERPEEGHRDDPFGRDRHHSGNLKSTDRLNSRRDWRSHRPYDRPSGDRRPPRPYDRSADDRRPPRPQDHQADDHRPRLTSQQLQWLQRMPSGWKF